MWHLDEVRVDRITLHLVDRQYMNDICHRPEKGKPFVKPYVLSSQFDAAMPHGKTKDMSTSRRCL
jgi:hypothetical protein